MNKLVLLLCAVILLGCGHKLKQGEIYERQAQPATTVMILMPMLCGKVTVLMPMWFYYPPRWYVSIKAYDGKKWRYSTYWLDEKTFDKTKKGMWFCVTADCMGEEPRQRVR